ncbi:AAA family ATPase [Cognataquiflexum rubidum]|uniref:AAA family ATPase n=1 Tax=Cognataquiflexum rubidum TaxID=2922273 RepID=UPI001F141FE0|nr:AAA family ATPase [Cognataquiflexum rubidum]MCH6236668.1 AAA family ATPase [Cognataquiflexum rubidum]
MRNFWHMQMHQPNSPVEIEKQILISRGVIGLNKWDTEQAGQQDAFEQKMVEGDIVAIKNGTQFVALVEVVGPYFESYEDKEFDWLVRRRKVKILDWYSTELRLKVSPRGTLTRCDQDGDAESTKSILKWYKLIQSGKMKNHIIELLKYKKQIILQGPPGTGKTRLAKEIAGNMISVNSVSDQDIFEAVYPNLFINDPNLLQTFLVVSIKEDTIRIKISNSENDYPVFLREIRKNIVDQPWDKSSETKIVGYREGFSWYVLQKIQEKQIKLLQFHPAYSYDDFVRGIVADTSEGIVSYRSINKVFAEISQKAWLNYQDSRKTPEQLSKEQEVDKYLELFQDFLEIEIESHDGKRFLEGTTTYLFRVEDDAVRYTGDNWKSASGQRLLFSDIKTLFLSDTNSRKDIKANPNVSGLAKQHASYFLRVLNLFNDFVHGKRVSDLDKRPITEQSYVLIIDEINRANLPSVLGELIYGLEYRGEVVESMYEVDGSRRIVIPPNLYIIGTMNTADRSVGHIDYAIRRRFAFVDVPPSDQPIRDVVKDMITQGKALALFQKVGGFFTRDRMNSDFEAKDVQLGHSYFLAEDEKTLNLKLEYEIKPLLREYVKDGILKGSVSEDIENLSV